MRLSPFAGALLGAVLAAAPAARAAGPYGGSDPGFLRQEAVIGSFPDLLGVTGIYAVDVDGDGTPEVLVGHDRVWYVLGRDASGEFRQRHFHQIEAVQWSYYVTQDSIVAVRPGDFDGDGRLEIAVLHASGRLEFHDAASGETLDEQQTESGAVSMAVGRLEGGTADRLAVVSPDGLFVHARGAPDPLWSVTDAAGVSVAIGQLDHDAALEIVVAKGSGKPGMVVDAATHEIEWTYPLGFGDLVDAGDVDGDGLDEIVTATEWSDATVLDADTRTLKWLLPSQNLSAVRAADVDGDGVKEVLLGNAQWSGIEVVDGATGAHRAHIDDPENGVSWIDVGRVRGGCDIDLVFGAGMNSTGRDRLFVVPTATGQIAWQNYEDDGPMDFAVGDVEGNGHTRLLRVSGESDAGYASGLGFLYDLAARRDLWDPPLPIGGSFQPLRPVVLAHAGGAGLAFVTNSGPYYTDTLAAFDGVTKAKLWEVPMTALALASGDVNGDGISEVLVAGTSTVSLLNGATGATLWTSPSLSGNVVGVALENVSGGPGAEILAAVSGQGLFAWDGVGHGLKWLRSIPTISAFAVGDVDGDGDPDVLVGTSDGTLYAYDGASLALLFQTTVEGGSIVALRVGDVASDGAKEIVLVTAGSSDPSLQVLKASDRTLLWSSGPLEARNPGGGNRLFVGDADGDGRVEVILASQHGLLVFGRPDPSDAAPPLFEGAPGVQSATAAGCCAAVDLTWNTARDAASPPVSYRVYRGAQAGVVPSPATLVAETPFTAWEDAAVARGTKYHYVVRAVDAAGNEDANAVELAASVPGGPSITAQPVSTDSCVGASAAFSVAATGVAPLHYQWLHDGVPLAGKTSAVLALSSLAESDAGAYRCVVTDSSGICPTVESAGAVLRIGAKGGDVNKDCKVDVQDVFVLINYLFAGGPPPLGDPDVNADEILDVRDVFYLINYLFSGGPAPAAPSPDAS